MPELNCKRVIKLQKRNFKIREKNQLNGIYVDGCKDATQPTQILKVKLGNCNKP